MKIKIGELTPKQKEQFDQLLEKHKDIFIKHPNDFGRTDVTTHPIDTKDEKPIKQHAYKTDFKKQEVIQKEINKMLEAGVIRRSTSPWTSPVVLIPKPDGSIRFCIDYRKLNKITRKDNQPLPRIDDLLDSFQKSKWFTSLDLAAGYWQVPMKPEDIEKTAFITHLGTYEFLVMPFGLCNAPATFQRMMNIIFEDLLFKFIKIYLDDCNIHSKTFEEHLQHLEEVFNRLRKAGLKLKPSKCHFCSPEIKFLGHIVGKDGIKADPSKVEKVKNFPIPTNLTELRGFIGLASYYRKFVPQFSHIAKPLTSLTKKDTPFIWSEKQNKAFEDLKDKLCSTPILQFPDLEKEFYLYTDASNYAMGAILAQKDEDNNEHAIAYASKGLNKHELNYTVTEKECLAIVWAIRHFEHYITGRHFTIVTDHYALKWLYTQKPKGRLARWIMSIQEHDFEIIHKEGKKHRNADALSRIPSQK